MYMYVQCAYMQFMYLSNMNLILLLISPDDPLSREPTMRELLTKVASRAMDKWDMVALELDIEQQQLNTINHPKPVRCYNEVFCLWQKKAEPPFTWATIIDALKSPIVGENKLAMEIEKWLRNECR